MIFHFQIVCLDIMRLSVMFLLGGGFYITPGRRQTHADQKSLETVFSITICRQFGDKWQSKTVSNDSLI